MEELNTEIRRFRNLICKKYNKHFGIVVRFDISDDLDEIEANFERVVEDIHRVIARKNSEIEKLQNHIVELYKMSKLLTGDIAAIKHRSNKIFIENFDLQNQFELIFKENRDICKLALEKR